MIGRSGARSSSATPHRDRDRDRDRDVINPRDL
jgi:hypothetical protein